MSQQSPNDVICRYLEDAIAAERNFENTLHANAKEAANDYPAVQALFEQHADETKLQYQRLEARLEALGGKPSGVKSFLAHLFGMAPKTAQIGHDNAERATQDLMMAFAVENSEIAMYEAMICACEEAGDEVTAQLARDIQAEERKAAELVWAQIDPVARSTWRKITTMDRELQRMAA
jgi:ferritin-like metal-binding protein YciE